MDPACRTIPLYQKGPLRGVRLWLRRIKEVSAQNGVVGAARKDEASGHVAQHIVLPVMAGVGELEMVLVCSSAPVSALRISSSCTRGVAP